MWLKTGLWVIIGIGNQYLTSPDGVVWTTRYLPISFSAQPAVSTTGDLMIIVNNNSGLAYLVSADGLAWEQGTLAASPYSFYNSGIANDGANFVLMGETYSQISS